MVMYVTPTVAIKEDTFKMLKSVKEEFKAETFDELIREIIARTKQPKESFFGRFKGLGSFKREEIDRFA